jgi:RHS repeat-associated protein
MVVIAKEFDVVSNPLRVQHLRARYYDPTVGQFTSVDPFSGSPEDPQSLHKYAYVHGDPIQGVDPTGEMFSFASLNAGSRLTAGSIHPFLAPLLTQVAPGRTNPAMESFLTVLLSSVGRSPGEIFRTALNTNDAHADAIADLYMQILRKEQVFGSATNLLLGRNDYARGKKCWQWQEAVYDGLSPLVNQNKDFGIYEVGFVKNGVLLHNWVVVAYAPNGATLKQIINNRNLVHLDPWSDSNIDSIYPWNAGHLVPNFVRDIRRAGEGSNESRVRGSLYSPDGTVREAEYVRPFWSR